MKMSVLGRQMLTELEGFKTRMYHDSAGLPTIGVGHLITQQELAQGYILIRATGQRINWREEISRDDVDAILAQDLPDYEDAVNRLVAVNLEQYQFDALVSFCFNVGETRFGKSTLLRMVNSGNFTAVVEQFRVWTKVTVNGKKVQVRGLLNRRNKEIAMWRGDLLPEPAPQPSEPEIMGDFDNPTIPPELMQQAPSVASIRPRQYAPNRWVMMLNPLDWFPGWGTYVSIAATAALYVADQTGYDINPAIGGVLAAFAAARLRRGIDR
jgi:lysozyme